MRRSGRGPVAHASRSPSTAPRGAVLWAGRADPRPQHDDRRQSVKDAVPAGCAVGGIELCNAADANLGCYSLLLAADRSAGQESGCVVALPADFRELTVAPVVSAAQRRRPGRGRPRGGRRRYGLGLLLHARRVERRPRRRPRLLAHPGVVGSSIWTWRGGGPRGQGRAAADLG